MKVAGVNITSKLIFGSERHFGAGNSDQVVGKCWLFLLIVGFCVVLRSLVWDVATPQVGLAEVGGA